MCWEMVPALIVVGFWVIGALYYHNDNPPSNHPD
jgi:hypothetical protein